MKLIALKPFLFDGAVLAVNDTFVTTSSHANSLERKGYAAPADGKPTPANPSDPAPVPAPDSDVVTPPDPAPHQTDEPAPEEKDATQVKPATVSGEALDVEKKPRKSKK